jgi:hypothetical protein
VITGNLAGVMAGVLTAAAAANVNNADAAQGLRIRQWLLKAGSDRRSSCSPRNRLPLTSRNEGSKRVSTA